VGGVRTARAKSLQPVWGRGWVAAALTKMERDN
jgi:hypothetical protein